MIETNGPTAQAVGHLNIPKRVTENDNCSLDVEEMADIIWLAAQIWQSSLDIQHASKQELVDTIGGSQNKKNIPNNVKDPTESTTNDSSIESSSTELEAPASIRLPSVTDSDSDPGSLPFFVPTASALPRRLDLARSLRPLKQTIPSNTQNEIDEILSAERSAETNTPDIVLRPKRRRWLDIVLIIDESPSMAMWHRTISEFITLLEQMGAFRNVISYGLAIEQVNDTTSSPLTLRLHTTINTGYQIGYACDPMTIVDLCSERVILVISDTSSEAWYSGIVPEWLKRWSKYDLVTILHMLPRNMWEQTALINELDVKLSSNIPCVPNEKLRVEWPWYWDEEDFERKKDRHAEISRVPIPVITLEPYSLGSWANLISGHIQSQTFGYIFLPEEMDEQEMTEIQRIQIDQHNLKKPQISLPIKSSKELFNSHWQSLSGPARKLACYLAAVPINLEIIRIVQQQIMGREARQTHIAELIYSGMFCQVGSLDIEQPLDELLYDFYGGKEVRRCWREKVERTQMVEVFYQITRYVEKYVGHGRNFQALLDNSSQHSDDPLKRAFAQIMPDVLRDLGSPYVEFLKRTETTSRDTSTPKSLNEFEWVTIPEGEFRMGADQTKDDKDFKDEKPQHLVYLSEYQISRVPVTNAQYKYFVEETKAKAPQHWKGGQIPTGKEMHPVVYVSWHEAQAFCEWAKARLPTEAEWEKAARGTDGRAYPWGNEKPNQNLLNYDMNLGMTTPVNRYPKGASPYDVLDMAGNVWEWTADWNDKNYYASSPKRDPIGPPNGFHRVLRGGAFFLGQEYVHCDYRSSRNPNLRSGVRGFRLVRRNGNRRV